ncbi:MAG: hypothetical protein A4E64_01805 [Syntrophorhabdus sp. PtaU1.Bin058]|nr:MAG: hypothetical protein A4E64_01805 [Syntrophorhabdus sp. PtaU1.Bin058]
MKRTKIAGLVIVICLLLLGLAPNLWTAEYKDFTLSQALKLKPKYDDPHPYLKDIHPQKFLAPEVYKQLTYDVEAMKKAWAETVGFKAPDVVGKKSPEIKPGVYNYKDKDKYPGLKELMIPEMYQRFAPGARPHAGNFPEIKIIPTRQYYYALPVAEATKKNEGKTKQDNKGYIVPSSYTAGCPFPRPSGTFKAQQIMYNWEKRYYHYESALFVAYSLGFNKSLNEDIHAGGPMHIARLQGRLTMEPFGWFDKRAETAGEMRALSMGPYEIPQDNFGNAYTSINYEDPNKADLQLIYIQALRRIRKMSATDSQDAVAGQDIIYDDSDAFNQKLSPTRYPYKYEVAEREMLMPAITSEGSRYISSKGLELRNFELERRPVYVITLTQLDKNYVYGKRTIYMDRELFLIYHVDNYDQKGRLYRVTEVYNGYVPEMGVFMPAGFLARDYIDLHSAYMYQFDIPTPSLTREQLLIDRLARVK